MTIRQPLITTPLKRANPADSLETSQVSRRPRTAAAQNAQGLFALPTELVHDILGRLPARDLLNVRLTCRALHAHANDPRFLLPHVKQIPAVRLPQAEPHELTTPHMARLLWREDALSRRLLAGRANVTCLPVSHAVDARISNQGQYLIATTDQESCVEHHREIIRSLPHGRAALELYDQQFDEGGEEKTLEQAYIEVGGDAACLPDVRANAPSLEAALDVLEETERPVQLWKRTPVGFKSVSSDLFTHAKVSRDARRALVAYANRHVKMVALDTGRFLSTGNAGAEVLGLHLDHKSNGYAFIRDNGIFSLDSQTGRPQRVAGAPRGLQDVHLRGDQALLDYMTPNRVFRYAVWSLSNGAREVSTFGMPQPGYVYRDHSNGPQGSYAVFTRGGRVSAVDLSAPRASGAGSVDLKQVFTNQFVECYRTKMSQGGRHIAGVGLDGLVVVDLADGSERFAEIPNLCERDLQQWELSPSGQQVVASVDQTLELWDFRTEPPTNLAPDRPAAYSVGFSPDGAYVAAANGSEMRIWSLHGNVVAGQPLSIEDSVGATHLAARLNFSEDGQQITIAGAGVVVCEFIPPSG